jgi:predicted TIM-barrel fold metal-dependent hydrolase
MNRREMLGVMGSALALESLRAEDVPFGRIDAHCHIHRSVAALPGALAKDNWRAMSVCVWEQVDSTPPGKSEVSNFKTIDELHAATAKISRESNGRIAWAATIEAYRFEERDFTERSIAMLQQCFKNGAVAVKFWKIIGMKIRGKDGHFMMPDEKPLLPIYEAIQKADRTLVAHFAEPNGAWLPLDSPDNNDASYYRNNPQWHAKAGEPDKETILQARDRVLARFPKLRVMGCHLGSNEENFRALAKRLDTYSNFCVDMSARPAHFFMGNLAVQRQFLEKYQDRLIYGSDNTSADTPEARMPAELLGQENREWAMFAGTQKIPNQKQPANGMGLPQATLRKLFHDNAVRVIPGIAPA